MSTANGNNELYQQWKQKSKAELKMKLENNYIQRANKSVNVVNNQLKRYIPNASNLALFQLSTAAITHSVQKIFQQIEVWKGVDPRFTKSKLTTFKEYFIRADNWWNRYKSQWIGDFFFYPLFTENISGYIYRHVYNRNCVKCSNNSNDCTDYGDLLHLIIIKEILCSEVKFKRAKKQPLLLDQSYAKSPLLQQFFVDIGNKHSVEWLLPPNVTNKKDYRNIIRKYSQDFVDKLINRKLMTMGVRNIKYVDFAAHICNHSPPKMVQSTTSSPNTPPQCHCNCIHRCALCDGLIPTASYQEITAPIVEASVHCRRPPASYRYTPYPRPPPPTDHNYNYTPCRSNFNMDWDNETVSTVYPPYYNAYGYL